LLFVEAGIVRRLYVAELLLVDCMTAATEEIMLLMSLDSSLSSLSIINTNFMKAVIECCRTSETIEEHL
jgi:hypothetical protein